MNSHESLAQEPLRAAGRPNDSELRPQKEESRASCSASFQFL